MNFHMLRKLSIILSVGGFVASCGGNSPTPTSELHGGSTCQDGIARKVSGSKTYYKYTAKTTANISGSPDKVDGCFYPTEPEAKNEVRNTCAQAQTYTCEPEGSWEITPRVFNFTAGNFDGYWIFIKSSGTQYFHDGRYRTFCALISPAHRENLLRAMSIDPKKITVYDPGDWMPPAGQDVGICPHLPPPDGDGDGIPDSQDKCPAQAENFNSYQDGDGCPDTPPPPDRSTYIKAWYAGFIMNNLGTAFYTNGQGRYCAYASEQHFNMSSGNWNEAKRRIRPDAEFPFFDYDGLCRLNIPMGYYTDNTAAIYYSNGINATCHIATPEQVLGSVVAYDFPIHTATTLQFTNLCRLGSLESVNFPGFYIRHRNSYADLTGIGSELDRLDASWNIVPGLGNASCVSFESRNYPGKFLRHSGFRLILSSYEDSVLFKNDATFCERPGRSDPALSSFESLNYPGYFLRHQDYQLKLHNATDAGALVDSTFKVVPSFK